jgi:hypothetical protein
MASPTYAFSQHSLLSSSASPQSNPFQLGGPQLPRHGKPHQHSPQLLQYLPTSFSGIFLVRDYSQLPTIGSELRFPMPFSILLLLQLVLLVPFIVFCEVGVVCPSRYQFSSQTTNCEVQIRRSLSFNALTLEAVKALEWTAVRVTGPNLELALRRKDILLISTNAS